jgi:hypothetical protein
MTPFVVLSLPRSRSAWLSRFLTYGEWSCGHEEIRHLRSIDDIKLWFSQPNTGTAETAGAPWWRTMMKFAPNTKVVVVRRPVEEVFDSLMALPGVTFDPSVLMPLLCKLDCKLDQIEARVPNVLSVRFADLADEAVCARVFEHCLPYTHDHDHWAALTDTNIQINMPATMRYMQAYQPALDKLAKMVRQTTLSDMALRTPVDPAGVTFQTEPFDVWLRDARPLIENHLVVVNEDPDNWKGKNLTLMQELYDIGAMQIMTARSNGRMFGYLMTLLSPSLVSEKLSSATNTTFYASPDVPGLGMKLQRAALNALKERGVNEVFFEAGKRGSGPRLSVLYERLGAQEHGTAYRLELAEV